MAIPVNGLFTPPKKRAFLLDPIAFSLTAPSIVDEKVYPIKTTSDYREEIPKIRDQILRSNNAHFALLNRHLMGYRIHTGKFHGCPFKFLPNLLGIHSNAKALLETKVNYNADSEPLIIETGDMIATALKEERLEAYYLENFGKIIVLSSSEFSKQDLRLIFEKHAFTTGLYPIVEEDRTEFGDLKIHLSDEPDLIQMPFMLPGKEEIFTYLHNNKFVSRVISSKHMTLISEKLENKTYNPENTIYNLVMELYHENVALKYNQRIALEQELPKFSTGSPSRK